MQLLPTLGSACHCPLAPIAVPGQGTPLPGLSGDFPCVGVCKNGQLEGHFNDREGQLYEAPAGMLSRYAVQVEEFATTRYAIHHPQL